MTESAEWHVTPAPAPPSASEWMTVARAEDGFWCVHWMRLRYDSSAAVTVRRQGPYDTPQEAEGMGKIMARHQGCDFVMPEIRRLPAKGAKRPVDEAAEWEREAMKSWINLSSTLARRFAFARFCERVSESAGYMAGKE